MCPFCHTLATPKISSVSVLSPENVNYGDKTHNEEVSEIISNVPHFASTSPQILVRLLPVRGLSAIHEAFAVTKKDKLRTAHMSKQPFCFGSHCAVASYTNEPPGTATEGERDTAQWQKT